MRGGAISWWGGGRFQIAHVSWHLATQIKLLSWKSWTNNLKLNQQQNYQKREEVGFGSSPKKRLCPGVTYCKCTVVPPQHFGDLLHFLDGPCPPQ